VYTDAVVLCRYVCTCGCVCSNNLRMWNRHLCKHTVWCVIFSKHVLEVVYSFTMSPSGGNCQCKSNYFIFCHTFIYVTMGARMVSHHFRHLEHNTPFFHFSVFFKYVQKSLQKYYHILFVPRLSACLRKQTWMLYYPAVRGGSLATRCTPHLSICRHSYTFVSSSHNIGNRGCL